MATEKGNQDSKTGCENLVSEGVLYSSDKDFHLDLKRLNVFENPYEPWRSCEGRKSHVDLFGDAVSAGEVHYIKEVGGLFDAPLRLSRRSMEKVLYVAVHLNPHIQDFADHILKQEWDEMLTKLNSSRPKR